MSIREFESHTGHHLNKEQMNRSSLIEAYSCTLIMKSVVDAADDAYKMSLGGQDPVASQFVKEALEIVHAIDQTFACQVTEIYVGRCVLKS